MKKFFLLLILLSSELFSSTIIGNPNVEINSEGLYLIQIKLTSTTDITEDDIFIANFKSDEELSDLNFEFKIFENLEDYKRLTLAIPKDYSEDYVSFRLDIKEELKKDTAEHSNPENETKIDDQKEGFEEKEEVIKNKTPEEEIEYLKYLRTQLFAMMTEYTFMNITHEVDE